MSEQTPLYFSLTETLFFLVNTQQLELQIQFATSQITAQHQFSLLQFYFFYNSTSLTIVFLGDRTLLWSKEYLHTQPIHINK
jgi:hypothetical protein